MRKILLCIGWLVLSGFGYADCSPDQLTACANTNQLIHCDEFKAALEEFVGRGKADWLYQDGDKIDQVIAVLGGPPEEPIEVGENLVRFSACRAHSCWEKGSAILTKDGTLVAIGIMHFSCGENCSDNYTLTIMQSKDKGQIKQELIKWGEDIVDEYNSSSYVKDMGDDFRTRLENIDIINVDSVD